MASRRHSTIRSSRQPLQHSYKVRQAIRPIQIRLCVVLPDSLEDDLDDIRRRLQLKDGILWEAEKRLFKVSHRITQGFDVSEDITFYDVLNILSSAAKLYDYSRLAAQKASVREWGYVIDLELRAFKNSPRRTRQRHATRQRAIQDRCAFGLGLYLTGIRRWRHGRIPVSNLLRLLRSAGRCC